METPKFYFSKEAKALVEIRPLTLTFHFEIDDDDVDIVQDELTFECNGKLFTEKPSHGFYYSQKDFEKQNRIKAFCVDTYDMFGFEPENGKSFYINHNGEPEKICLDELEKITYDFEADKYAHRLSGTECYGSIENYYNYEDYKVIDKDGKETIVEGKYKKFIFSEEQEKALKALEDAKKALNDVGLSLIWDNEREDMFAVNFDFKIYPYDEYLKEGYTFEDTNNEWKAYDKFSRMMHLYDGWLCEDNRIVINKN